MLITKLLMKVGIIIQSNVLIKQGISTVKSKLYYMGLEEKMKEFLMHLVPMLIQMI